MNNPVFVDYAPLVKARFSRRAKLEAKRLRRIRFLRKLDKVAELITVQVLTYVVIYLTFYFIWSFFAW